MRCCCVVLALYLASLPCLAQHDVATTAADIPENPNSRFEIRAELDRPARRYRPGDTLTLSLRAERTCYVTIFDVGTSGKVTLLLPNRFRSDNRLLAGSTISFPGPEDGFEYAVGLPAGIERIAVVGTTYPVDLTPGDLAHYADSRSLFQTAAAPSARALMAQARDVLSRAAAGAGDWSSDQVTFQIDNAPQLQPASSPQQSQIWAFVAAVADYPGNANDLDYAVADARLFAKVLQEHMRVPASNLLVKTDAAATRQGFAEGLDWLAQHAGRKDKAFIFYSGHGSTEADNNGDEDDGVDEYLCLYDGMLCDDDFGQMVHRIKCDNVVTFVDTCFSGGAARGIKFRRPTARASQVPEHARDGFGAVEWRVRTREVAPEGFSMFAASQPGQVSREDPDLKQGVFTYFLAKGLQGAVGNPPITLRRLYEYTYKEAMAHTHNEQAPCLLPQNADLVLMPSS